MTVLGVIGNISIDTARYPGRRTHRLLGGAALYVALAAARADLLARPVAIVGDGLARLRSDPRLDGLDLRHVSTVRGLDCRFDLTYDRDGRVVSVHSDYGVAADLTSHALTALEDAEVDQWHVACRRPLDTIQILRRLLELARQFSVDFHLASADEQIAAAQAVIPFARMVFVNTAEQQFLARHIDLATLPAVVVSDGPHEAVLRRHGTQTATAVPPTISTREVTGAGDTLTGTFLALTASGASDHDALTGAVTAASHRAASPGLRYRT
ncbi:carbohydrate kinase family protein [Actinomadura sp. 7K507]|uniref:carbohydrate kinase family protein n=1 Tax=Actinomadura sp. 7K507 TaxID=2530365 RepID=UPI00104E1E72|nr:carbohydrate kinase family protein [Actinomadura sp. 7K507]TDC91966.1 carbohydrate kinase family protein [Actinomadura sp. 7K507]